MEECDQRRDSTGVPDGVSHVIPEGEVRQQASAGLWDVIWHQRGHRVGVAIVVEAALRHGAHVLGVPRVVIVRPHRQHRDSDLGLVFGAIPPYHLDWVRQIRGLRSVHVLRDIVRLHGPRGDAGRGVQGAPRRPLFLGRRLQGRRFLPLLLRLLQLCSFCISLGLGGGLESRTLTLLLICQSLGSIRSVLQSLQIRVVPLNRHSSCNAGLDVILTVLQGGRPTIRYTPCSPLEPWEGHAARM
mmetsp:Transcript_12486/g.35069  ORF Transcript_12486/g.35069 Transcript_12486/m.35069 type:complete len:242 (+) Transcript_12486:2765-3490(+)